MFEYMKKETKLPIPPMVLGGEVKEINIKDIKSGILPGISYKRAVVSYCDILGFANKKNNEDIEVTLLDFSAPLAIASGHYPNVRFNVFSDCAFISTPIKNAQELLASMRFAFTQWIADGILVRAGITLGQYRETRSNTLYMALKSKNFIGNLFSGSGIVEAVKLEGAGNAALLFTNEETAGFFGKKYKEPIFTIGQQYILAWFDDRISLFWYTGISFLRLVRLLQNEYDIKDDAVQKLQNNIKYSFSVVSEEMLPLSLIMALLSFPEISANIRKISCDLFGIKDPDDFIYYKKLIDVWVSKEELKMLKFIADADSSIPGYKPTQKFW